MEPKTTKPEVGEDAPPRAEAEAPEYFDGTAEGALLRFEIDWEPGPRLTTVLKARWRGVLFHSDSFNLAKAEARKKFVKEVAHKAEAGLRVLIPAEAIEASAPSPVESAAPRP